MKTYPTFVQAKIDNPVQEIYKVDGNMFVPYAQLWHDAHAELCNPADYCSTVEEFLAAGHKFEIGDICLRDDSTVVAIDSQFKLTDWSTKDSDYDGQAFVLKSEAANGGSKIPDDRCQQDEESDADVLRRIADKLENQEAAKAIIEQSSSSVKESPMSFDEVVTEAHLEEWSGEGHPPVGVECEASENDGDWYAVTILYVGNHGVIVDDQRYAQNEQWLCHDEYTFRPLKTPEQVEVEELAYILHKSICEYYKAPLKTFEQYKNSVDFECGLYMAKAAIKHIKGE